MIQSCTSYPQPVYRTPMKHHPSPTPPTPSLHSMKSPPQKHKLNMVPNTNNKHHMMTWRTRVQIIYNLHYQLNLKIIMGLFFVKMCTWMWGCVATFKRCRRLYFRSKSGPGVGKTMGVRMSKSKYNKCSSNWLACSTQVVGSSSSRSSSKIIVVYWEKIFNRVGSKMDNWRVVKLLNAMMSSVGCSLL